MSIPTVRHVTDEIIRCVVEGPQKRKKRIIKLRLLSSHFPISTDLDELERTCPDNETEPITNIALYNFIENRKFPRPGRFASPERAQFSDAEKKLIEAELTTHVASSPRNYARSTGVCFKICEALNADLYTGPLLRNGMILFLFKGSQAHRRSVAESLGCDCDVMTVQDFRKDVLDSQGDNDTSVVIDPKLNEVLFAVIHARVIEIVDRILKTHRPNVDIADVHQFRLADRDFISIPFNNYDLTMRDPTTIYGNTRNDLIVTNNSSVRFTSATGKLAHFALIRQRVSRMVMIDGGRCCPLSGEFLDVSVPYQDDGATRQDFIKYKQGSGHFISGADSKWLHKIQQWNDQ